MHLATNYKQTELYDELCKRIEFDTHGLQHRSSNSRKLYRFEYLTEMGKHVTRGYTRVVRRWRTSGPAIRGVLLNGMPNSSIYLYACLLLFLTDVLLPSLLSLSASLTRFFSTIKIYAHSCTRCVHIAFRLAQCSFCAGLRTRPKRLHTHTQIYVPRYDPVFLSRFSHLALSLTSLFVSAARDRAVVDGRKIYEEKTRATKGPPITVSFQRNCGGSATESSACYL